MIGILFAAATLLTAGDTRLVDRVELTDGSVAQGRVVYSDPGTVVVRSGSREREIPRKDVKSVSSRADDQRSVIERWRVLSPADAGATLDLARFCRSRDLLEEMRLFAWWVLLSDPESVEAHAMLDHARVKDGWLVREGARRVAFDKAIAGHTDWNDAWELETTHYSVRTNLPLGKAICAALDLENHYHAFLATFGTELRLYEVVEPLHANIHADAKSFSALSSGRSAWFDPAARAIEIDASRRLDLSDLTHEATHAMIHATSVDTRSARGHIPAWLDEGLAEYMSAGFQGQPGRLRFTRSTPFRAHFAAHAQAAKPYDLSRVLNFGSSDFAVNARSDLKYAQAYTLVHFGLESDGGALRGRFLDFLRSARRGQSSQTHFSDALKMDDAKIERAWSAYVKTTAGA